MIESVIQIKLLYNSSYLYFCFIVDMGFELQYISNVFFSTQDRFFGHIEYLVNTVTEKK